MFVITGDTHGNIDISKLSSKKFIQQKTMTKDDYVIICGDFGCIWYGDKRDDYWLNWLNNKPFTTLFIDGNHENFDLLTSYPVSEFHGGKVHKINDSVYHLMRGQVFDIDNTKFFTMGGARSHDQQYRKENVSWWSNELPCEKEYDEAISNLDAHNWDVDIVITHCAPDQIQLLIADWYEHDKLTNFLRIVYDRLTYKKWFFGHYHIDKTITKKDIAVYDNLIIL